MPRRGVLFYGGEVLYCYNSVVRKVLGGTLEMAGSAASRDFSKGKVWKIIMAQSVPMTIAHLVQILYNIVDRIYIGHMPGTGGLALTGVGLALPVVTLVMAFSSLFASGAVPLFSIARGAGERDRAHDIMGNAFALVLIFSAFVTIFFMIFRVRALYFFGASDATIGYAEDYLRIYLWGVVFSMTASGMNGFISSLGFPKTAMFTVVIGAVINLVLDPIFIFSFGMGVAGAAAATVISQFVSSLWVLRFLTARNLEISLKPSRIRIKKDLTARMLTLGISGFVQQGTNSIVQIVCNVALRSWGGDIYVGVMTIINSIREVVTLPVTGLREGAQPVLGFNYGAKENERVKAGIRFVSFTGICYTAVLWLPIAFLPGMFLRLFTNDAQTLALGVRAMRLYFCGFIFMSLQFSAQCVFVALGKAKRAIFFSLLRKVFIVVPLTLLLPMLFGLGTDGVFLAEPISDLLGGAAAMLTMYFTLYRKL